MPNTLHILSFVGQLQKITLKALVKLQIIRLNPKYQYYYGILLLRKLAESWVVGLFIFSFLDSLL